MLIRLVRMTFRPDAVRDFLEIFDTSSPQIRAFPGCLHLELWEDVEHENVFTTFSLWTEPDALEAYRHSAVFRSTWKRTKPLFSERPVATSHTRRETVAPGDSA